MRVEGETEKEKEKEKERKREKERGRKVVPIEPLDAFSREQKLAIKITKNPEFRKFAEFLPLPPNFRDCVAFATSFHTIITDRNEIIAARILTSKMAHEFNKQQTFRNIALHSENVLLLFFFGFVGFFEIFFCFSDNNSDSNQ